MSNGRHASSDNSYSRSASGAVVRGGLLLLVAVLVAVFLLQSADSGKKSPTKKPTTADSTAVAGTDTTAAAGVTPIVTSTTAVRRAPNLVKVLIVNGSGKNRAASRVKAFLASSGYDFQVPRDAKATNLADGVFYKPGFDGEAASIAAILGLTPDKVIPLPIEQTVRTPPAVPLFDVQVMVGPELATKYATQSLTPAAGAAAGAGATATTTTKAA